MEYVLDMAEQLGMTEEQGARIMGEIKEYLNNLMREIMLESGMPQDQIENTARSLAYALDGMEAREYLYFVADMFSGKGDTEAIGDFVNTNFEMPDLSDIKQYIFDQITNGFREGMKNAPPNEDGSARFDDQTIEAIVEKIGGEMKNEYGPNFYALPPLLKELGASDEEAFGVIQQIQGLLDESLTKAVKRVNGLPGEVQ